MKCIKQLITLIVQKCDKRDYSMKSSIIFAVILYVFTGTSYAVFIAINYSNPDSRQGLYKCDSLDVLQELNRISKFDSTKDSMIAKYCLYSKEDSAWELSFYEQIIPLAIKIQKECSGYSISGTIDLGIKKIFRSSFSGGANGGCIKTCTGSKEACEKLGNVCKIDISEKYNIYNHINDFSIISCLKGMDTISHLFNKYLPIKWDLNISCDDEKIPVLGSHYIYISGLCTEEQLKKIEENKKKKADDKNEKPNSSSRRANHEQDHARAAI